MNKNNLKRFIVVVSASLIIMGLGISCDNNNGGNTTTENAASSQEAVSNQITVWPPALSEGQAVVKNRAAVNYYIVLDASSSMDDESEGEKKIEAAKKALIIFTKKIPLDANIGFLVFNGSDIVEKLPLGVNDEARQKQFAASVKEVSANGNTPLKSSITIAYEKLTEQAQKQLGYGEYHLVVVTDGEATPWLFENPESIVNKIIQTPIVLHTIGFGIGTDHSLNQPGKTYYMSANNPEELKQGLLKVLAESEKFSDL